jgi:dTDP-4-dehydrorhamnose 3,5-epimerase
MQFKKTHLAGIWVIDPSPHKDDRGQFMRAWCAREFAENGIDFVPVQANMSSSCLKGTIRGMHYQLAPALEAKLVRCTRGAIFDVAIDLRPNSSTYGEWCGVELTSNIGNMLYVPPLCAHGFQTLEDDTEIHYMASEYFTPSTVRGVRFNDPAFKIQWRLDPTAVSEQDRSWPLL